MHPINWLDKFESDLLTLAIYPENPPLQMMKPVSRTGLATVPTPAATADIRQHSHIPTREEKEDRKLGIIRKLMKHRVHALRRTLPRLFFHNDPPSQKAPRKYATLESWGKALTKLLHKDPDYIKKSSPQFLANILARLTQPAVRASVAEKTMNPAISPASAPREHKPLIPPPPPPRMPYSFFEGLPLRVTTLNVQGMHTTLYDVDQLLQQQHPPDVLVLTETKHKRPNKSWSELLRGFRLVHHPTKTNPATGRRHGGLIIAANRCLIDSYVKLPIPEQLTPHVGATYLIPISGIPILLIGLYMPQLCDRPIYEECLTWVNNAITTHPNTPVLIGGDFQCNIHHPPPWMQSCLTGIRILTPH